MKNKITNKVFSNLNTNQINMISSKLVNAINNNCSNIPVETSFEGASFLILLLVNRQSNPTLTKYLVIDNEVSLETLISLYDYVIEVIQKAEIETDIEVIPIYNENKFIIKIINKDKNNDE